MATYYVRDTFGFVTVVEADSFYTNAGAYVFYNTTTEGPVNSTAVGNFRTEHVVSVIEDEAFETHFPAHEDEEDPEETGEEEECGECDGVCLDCRFKELLDSDEFFEAVYDVIEAREQATSEMEAEDAEAEATAPEVGPVEIRWNSDREYFEYGFTTPKGWVGFNRADKDDKETAEESRAEYLGGGEESWFFEDIGVTVPLLKVVKCTPKDGDSVQLGFLTTDGFVNFYEGVGEEGAFSSASYGLKQYNEGFRKWRYTDPSKYTFSEVENG